VDVQPEGESASRRPRHARDRLVRLGRDRLWQRLWQDDTSPLTWAVAYVAAPNRSTPCRHAAQPAAAPVFITGRVGKRRHLRQVAYHHLMTHLFGPPLNLVAEGGRGDDTKSSWQFRIVVAVIAHRDAMCGNLQSKICNRKWHEGQRRIEMQNIVGTQGILPS